MLFRGGSGGARLQWSGAQTLPETLLEPRIREHVRALYHAGGKLRLLEPGIGGLAVALQPSPGDVGRGSVAPVTVAEAAGELERGLRIAKRELLPRVERESGFEPRLERLALDPRDRLVAADRQPIAECFEDAVLAVAAVRQRREPCHRCLGIAAHPARGHAARQSTR